MSFEVARLDLRALATLDHLARVECRVGNRSAVLQRFESAIIQTVHAKCFQLADFVQGFICMIFMLR